MLAPRQSKNTSTSISNLAVCCASAAGHRRDFMARDKAKLVDTLNTARLDLYADLTKRVAANGLDRAWAEGFFRRGSAKPETATPDAPPQPA